MQVGVGSGKEQRWSECHFPAVRAHPGGRGNPVRQSRNPKFEVRNRSLAIFVLALVFSAVAVPFAAEAQRSEAPRIGILSSYAKPDPHVEALKRAIRALGWVEGENIVLENRYANGEFERLPNLAADLVRVKVDVIVVDACGAPLNAASQATRIIPIVVAACNDDLVATGLISSLARPGGNLTGLSELTPELGAKRLELLKEAAQGEAGGRPMESGVFRAVQRQLFALVLRLERDANGGPSAKDDASIHGDSRPRRSRYRVLSHGQGASRGSDYIFGPVKSSHRERITDLAAKNRLPAVYASERSWMQGA